MISVRVMACVSREMVFDMKQENDTHQAQNAIRLSGRIGVENYLDFEHFHTHEYL